MAEGHSVGRWIAGIMATVIAGVSVAVIVDWIRERDNGGGSSTSGGTASTASPKGQVEQQNAVEAITGDWQLSWWKEADNPVTLGMEPSSGTMQVSRDGAVRWVLEIDDLYWDDSGLPQAAVTCIGVVSLDGILQGQVSDMKDYTSNMTSAQADISAAFCGGDVGPDDHPFEVQHEPPSNATALQMTNDLGQFSWQR